MTASIEFDVEVLVDPDDIVAARRLQASRYLESGFVTRLDDGGVIDDPWVSVSTYFGASTRDGVILGVSRLIPYRDDVGLPVFEEFELVEAEVERFRSVDPDTVVEVSALAVSKQSVVLSGRVAAALYRAMSQFCFLETGMVNWYAALDARVLRQLIRSYDFIFEAMGPAREYLGSTTVPVRLNLYEQARHFALVAPDAPNFFTEGIEFDLTGPSPIIRAATHDYLPPVRAARPRLHLAESEATAARAARSAANE